MPVYEPSPKHCEPITAQRPGLKCPEFSTAIAQELLDESEPMGDKRVATRNGIAFVAQEHGDDRWHGYPEAWDKISLDIKLKWKRQKKVQPRDLRKFGKRSTLRELFGGTEPR